MKHGNNDDMHGYLQWYQQDTQNHFQARPGQWITTDEQATALSNDVCEESMGQNKPQTICTQTLPQGHARSKKRVSEHVASYF